MEAHDANGLDPRIRGYDQVSAEAAEKFIGKGQNAPLTQPLSCEAVGGRPHHQWADPALRMVSNVATSTLPRPGAAALLAAAAIAYQTVGISPAHANDFSNCRLKKEAARCRGTRSASP